MKKCMKNTAIAASLVMAGTLLFAQNAQNARAAQGADDENIEEISLPDVSTVVSGGAPKVGKSAVPDYSEVLPESNKSGTVLPRLPDSTEASSAGVEAVSGTSSGTAKNIYAEGIAGAGYPGFVTGNFSLYRQSGTNPFRIQFSHETANGYAGNSLTSGYFDRTTFIYADKTFSNDKMKLFLKGRYENSDNGLQNKVTSISDVSKDKIEAEIDWGVQFTKEAGMHLALGGDWYKRYATITDSTLAVADFAENVSVLDLEPHLSFLWKSEKNLYLGFSAKYDLEHDIKDAFFDTRSINRGEFGVQLGWNNQSVRVYGDAAAVVGNEIGDNYVVVPFTAGADFSINTALSSRTVGISLKGGIDSYLPKVEMLERRWTFSALHVLPSETSDWFGVLDIAVPVKDVLTLGMNTEFRTTAYDNGTWQPDYDIDDSAVLFGQYNYLQDDMTQFNTEFTVGLRYKIAYFNFGWKNHWKDVPAAESGNSVSLGVSVQDEKAKFGFDGSMEFALASGDDHTPQVDLSVFWRLTNAVRLAVSTNDVVKLISGTERDYAGQYIQRSGTASVLVKFFF